MRPGTTTCLRTGRPRPAPGRARRRARAARTSSAGASGRHRHARPHLAVHLHRQLDASRAPAPPRRRRGHGAVGRARSACPTDLPQLARDVRHERRQQEQDGRRPPRAASPDARVSADRRRSRHQLHHRRDRRVEVEALDRRPSVTRAIVWCVSAGAARASTRGSRRRRRRPARARRGAHAVHEPPDAVQEAAHPLDALVAPVEIALGRRREEREEPRRVGAVALDEVVGVDDVALRLAHLGAVLDDHPLGQQAAERLVEPLQDSPRSRSTLVKKRA